MAKIKKIIEEGSIQYPATITDAVKNPNNGKTVTQELSELGSEVSDITVGKKVKSKADADFIKKCVVTTTGGTTDYETWDSYCFINDGYKKIRAKLFSNNTEFVVLSFFKTETINHTALISTVSPTSTTEAKDYEVDIPDDCKLIVASNRTGSFANPTVDILGLSIEDRIDSANKEIENVNKEVKEIDIQLNPFDKFDKNSIGVLTHEYFDSGYNLVPSDAWNCYTIPNKGYKLIQAKIYTNSPTLYCIAFYRKGETKPFDGVTATNVEPSLYDYSVNVPKECEKIVVTSRIGTVVGEYVELYYKNVSEQLNEINEIVTGQKSDGELLKAYPFSNGDLYPDTTGTNWESYSFQNKPYYKKIKAKLVSNNTSYYSIAFYNSFEQNSGSIISDKSYHVNTANVLEDVEIDIPENCQSFVISSRVGTNPRFELSIIASFDDIISEVKKNTDDKSRANINILFVGNSYTLDAVSYLPWILDSLDNNVDYTIGVAYHWSSTLEMVNTIFGGTDIDGYGFYYMEYHKGDKSWGASSTPSVDSIMKKVDWDVITFQQGSEAANDYATYQPFFNNITKLLFSLIDHNAKIGWIMVPSKDGELESSVTRYNGIANATKELVENSIVDFVIPVGTAIQNLRTTSVQAVGTNLMNNGHLQEGIAPQCEAYAAAISILGLIGKGKVSVYGNTVRCTEEWVSTKNIKDRQGVSEGVTDENCRIAQVCAIMACKNPYEITDASKM